MLFEWDPRKNAINQFKHGISFEEAREVFDDPLHLSFVDHRFSYFEERWITVGQIRDTRLLVVAHVLFTITGEEVIRIISAREAAQNERRQYEKF
jgi:hypothetical protein